MELVKEIDGLLDAIDKEIALLNRVTLQMSNELDTQATQDMVQWLSAWNPLQPLEEIAK